LLALSIFDSTPSPELPNPHTRASERRLVEALEGSLQCEAIDELAGVVKLPGNFKAILMGNRSVEISVFFGLCKVLTRVLHRQE